MTQNSAYLNLEILAGLRTINNTVVIAVLLEILKPCLIRKHVNS